MKVGDIVTTKSLGNSVHFFILGYYTDESSGEVMAVIALLDPSLVRTTPKKELIPTEISDLFAVPSNILTVH